MSWADGCTCFFAAWPVGELLLHGAQSHKAPEEDPLSLPDAEAAAQRLCLVGHGQAGTGREDRMDEEHMVPSRLEMCAEQKLSRYLAMELRVRQASVKKRLELALEHAACGKGSLE